MIIILGKNPSIGGMPPSVIVIIRTVVVLRGFSWKGFSWLVFVRVLIIKNMFAR
jgi:hypothetical protein